MKKAKKAISLGVVLVITAMMILPASAIINRTGGKNNRSSPEPVVNVVKIETTPISESMEVAGTKSLVKHRAMPTSIQVTDNPEDEFSPAIGVDLDETFLLAYTFKEDIFTTYIPWRFSIDNGETWSDPLAYDIEGGEGYPALDYSGSGKKFCGTLQDPINSDGSLQYLFRCDDVTDPETYSLTYWDWAASYPYRDRRIPDIGGYVLEEVPWFYGIMACAGTRDVRVDMPIFNYMNYEDENSGWSSYWDEFQGCQNVAVEVDQTNGYFYAVFDYLNETKGDWDLLLLHGDCHNDGEGHPIWFDAQLIGGIETNRYPSVAAHSDIVMIVAQQDELIPGKQDIVCYYSSDAGNNWDMSIVAADPAEDELYPSIVSYGISATCTFTIDGNLYVSHTVDGGATWTEPEKINDQVDTVESGYRNADITAGGNVVWTDNRNENLDIYFDNIGLPPTSMIGIESISGGFGVKATVTNIGTMDATDVGWTIDLEGGLVIIGRHSEDTIPTLAAGGETTIKSGLVLGFGRVDITVTADGAEETATGFVLGPFVLGVS